MKRDLDLIKELLEYVEENYNPDAGMLNSISIPGYSKEEVVEHCKLLYDFGYIQFFQDWSIDLGPQCAVGNLTNDGYDALAAFKDDTMFKRIKKFIAEKGGLITRKIIDAAIAAVVGKLLG